ncbi:CDP-alcohol phosphatidyltransferase family protein [Epibacterium ulvae]|uniref:CDP-alcohol phosphatidyltransferase family protein n=1 Tax=Epibacterium ulvae TaxID=1156985 RepID=UPI0024922858|nr:CDP-alcohol phosphatidyltransferase family protein [Epibacterium ulvae]
MGIVTQESVKAVPPSPVRSFLWAALLGGMCLVGLSWVFIQAQLLPLILGLLCYMAVAAWMAMRMQQFYLHTVLGLCNLVTLARLVLVAVLFVGLIAAEPVSWAGFCLAFVALSLDGIDGWLARKQGLSSTFGAAFDMQVDALLGLVLALSAALNAGAGVAVIFLGLPYYLFVLAGVFLPWLNAPLPDRFSRKAVCVAQIAVLIFLQMPVFANGTLDVLVMLVVCALIWSFGRDILWLKRARP